MAGSELVWLASSYLLVVENGLSDDISSSDMELWLATSQNGGWMFKGA